jgi:hypothetical protein
MVKLIYLFIFIILAFTGFGQMPIFKRYGISSIPGMGWSADYYITHYIHYLGAIVLIALMAYALVDFLASGRKSFRLTAAGSLQIILLSGIVATGVFRVLKNLPHVVFSPGFTMFIDLAHLGIMMFYLIVALILKLTGRGWLRSVGE